MKAANKLLTIEGLMTSDVWAACSCPTHRCILVRASTRWTCPKAANCVGLISDELLLDRVIDRLPRDTRDRIGAKERRMLLREIKRLATHEHTPPIYEGVSP